MTEPELNKRFDYHAPDEDAKQRHQDARDACKALATHIVSLGESRETSLALTNLEQTMFWINAHIARNS